MSDSPERPWSSNPNAPGISNSVYLAEKEKFVGSAIGAVLYGIVVVLFFQCLVTLFNPANRTRAGIKWGLVAYTTAMFTFVTIYTAMILDFLSIFYIDNRNFHGLDGAPAGPLGYQSHLYSKAIGIIPDVMFYLNIWLADGLLLYHGFVIYSRNYWAIALPCLMYLFTFAMGTLLTYKTSQLGTNARNAVAVSNFGVPYFFTSASLNVLLTLMIVIRLSLHGRKFRNSMDAPTRSNGPYKAIITILIQSSALYAVAILLFIGPWSISVYIDDVFFSLLAEIRVIAPFLIILRVTNRRALASDIIVSRNAGSIHSRSQREPVSSVGTLPYRNSVNSMDGRGKILDEFGAEVVMMINLQDKKD